MRQTTHSSMFLGFLVLFAVVTILPAQSASVDESIVLWLPFEEDGGDTTQDLSQFAHEANLVNGPALVDGTYGKALQFDGTNYVMVPITDTLQLRDAFTAEFWVKRDADQPSDWNYMVAAGSLKWAVIFNADQKVYIYTDGGGWAHRLTTDVPLTQEWTHVAATYDSSDGVNVYFNGEQAGTGGAPPEVVEIDGSIMIGARHPGQEFFRGIIDDVILYNRVLTLAEIQSDMNGGLQAVDPAEKLTTTWAGLKTLD